jgi:hypothetical protein
MDFKAPKFKKGDMVRWHLLYESEKSLGVVLEQDAGKVKVHWVISPRRVSRAGPKSLLDAWYPIYKIQRVTPTEWRFSEAN